MTYLTIAGCTFVNVPVMDVVLVSVGEGTGQGVVRGGEFVLETRVVAAPRAAFVG